MFLFFFRRSNPRLDSKLLTGTNNTLISGNPNWRRRNSKGWIVPLMSVSCSVITPVFHASSQHIELDYHYVGDLVAAGYVEISIVPSHLQVVAYIVTKGLTSPVFSPSLCILLLLSLRGSIIN
ncbi:uncharacterized protein LOC113317756 isoform X1 [Papaver somniferum]|uniref:uncharacterized protein LOC113317756 isoform X1 n=1 Tax=Papaver somniferum TaxID=3469 RepID=UPI000E702A8E|nr:uncharacterized protein LOC113317756 isoform X1 [Papaver somniferum]